MEIRFSRGFISEEEAKDVKKVAKKCNINLYVHTPSYINLSGDKRNIDQSLLKIEKTMRLGHLMGAQMAVTSLGFYGSHSKKETMRRILTPLRHIRDEMKKNGIHIPIGIETRGKQDVFGSIEEVVEVCKRVKGIKPVIDIGHLYARCLGCINTKDDIEHIFQTLKPLNLNHYLIYITGIKYDGEGGLYHVPIKKSDVPVIQLMEHVVENNYDVTFISQSPVVEHDAVYMQILFDRAMEMVK
jgi:deoxyribonuclease-4